MPIKKNVALPTAALRATWGQLYPAHCFVVFHLEHLLTSVTNKNTSYGNRETAQVGSFSMITFRPGGLVLGLSHISRERSAERVTCIHMPAAPAGGWPSITACSLTGSRKVRENPFSVVKVQADWPKWFPFRPSNGSFSVDKSAPGSCVMQ